MSVHTFPEEFGEGFWSAVNLRTNKDMVFQSLSAEEMVNLEYLKTTSAASIKFGYTASIPTKHSSHSQDYCNLTLSQCRANR